MEYKEGQSHEAKEPCQMVFRNRQEVWQTPERDEVKINVSSYCEDAEKGVGLGLLARNETGAVLQAWSVARDGVNNSVVADVETVRVALLMTQQNGWRKVDIQVDIKTLE